MKKYKTIIVDDEIAALRNLNTLVLDFEEIEVLSLHLSPEDAIANIIYLKPDLVFLDVEMPRISGFELLEKINFNGNHPKVVFTTAYSEYAIQAIKNAAFDYLLKPIDIDELRECINKLGDINNIIKNNSKKYFHTDLTPREFSILNLLLLGKSSQSICEELEISKSTVDKHRRNILEKTELKSTSELISHLLGY